MNIGIESTHRQNVAKQLSKFLADTYALYLKTQNFHWNVTGPHFDSMHAMFAGQYEDLAAAVDEIAERIRILGKRAPGSFAEFSQLTDIKEQTAVRAEEMLKQLLQGHEILIASAREVLASAQAAGDEGTINLIADRMSTHEKTAWMLRSFERDV